MAGFYRRLLVSLAWAGFLPALMGSVALGVPVKPIPWLGGVTTNSVYACLEANNTTAATVQYGLTNAYGMSAATESTELTSAPNYVHNVKLTGLSPNTQYHYKVTQGGVASADYSFWTAPLAGTPAHWGFAADSRTNIAIHNNVAAQIANKAPRMMVYGGDLPADGSYGTWNNEWFVPNQNALNATSPFVNSSGNHEGWNAMTKAFTQSPAGNDPDYFSFDYGDSHILVLNYNVSQASGSPQWNFAAADLAATNQKFKIVVSHAPAYVYGGHGNNAAMIAMTTGIFEPNGVDLVLSGDSHLYQHNLINGIHHMTIGSFGAPLHGTGTGPGLILTASTECYGIFDTTADTLTLRTYRGLDSSSLETIVIVVPEPSTLILLGVGAMGLLAYAWRRRRTEYQCETRTIC